MNNTKIHSDKEIINGLKAGGPPFEKYSLLLYRKCKSYIFKAHKKYPSLTEEDLHDAYVDAVDSLIKIVVKGEYKEKVGKLSTLLYQIFSNKSIDQLRRQTNHKSDWLKSLDKITEDIPVSSRDFLTTLMSKSDFDNVMGIMDDMNDICKDLIMDFDYWGFKPDEVAKRRGYKSGKSASQAKYKCMEALRKLIKVKPVLKTNNDDS